MPKPEPEPGDYGFIRPAEAAHMLGITTLTLWRWACDEKLPSCLTIGGQRRYRRADVAALVEALSS